MLLGHTEELGDPTRRTIRCFSIVLGQTGSKSGSNSPLAADERGKAQVDRWGGQDLNLRPTDYESAALTN